MKLIIFFASITSVQNNPVTLNSSTSTNEFSFKFVDQGTVLKIINSLKSSAVGFDGVSATMIKLCCYVILPYLTHIINSVIESSIYPGAWKQSLITPLPKISNPSQLCDLRPISILPTISKIFERIVQSQMLSYIEDKGLLPSIQSGFRAGYGCETALLKISDDILAATDRSLISALVLLDFSKAFDTVNHLTLVDILRGLGFGPSAVQLLQNYLSGREQRVKLGSCVSRASCIGRGVPQGSVLGPLLFAIYTHDLSRSIKFCNCHMYADDTQLYYTFKPNDWKQAADRINSDLDAVSRFSLLRNLTINPNKSHALLFGKQKICDELTNVFDIRLGGESVPIVHSAKNLGLIIDNTHRYRDQIVKYIKNAFLQLKKLFPFRSVLNVNIKIKLCEAFVLSQFTYCSAVYHPAIDCLTAKRIQRVQNACLRFIYGIRKYDHISYKLFDCGW